MWALYALLLLAVAVIQGVIFGRARYFGTKLSLIPVAVACIAMHGGAEDGGVFGLAAGLFWCLSGGDGGGVLIICVRSARWQRAISATGISTGIFCRQP